MFVPVQAQKETEENLNKLLKDKLNTSNKTQIIKATGIISVVE